MEAITLNVQCVSSFSQAFLAGAVTLKQGLRKVLCIWTILEAPNEMEGLVD